MDWPPELGFYACPNCKGPFTPAAEALRCRSCNRTYSLRGEIPDFIQEDLALSANPVLRKAKFFDWAAPIYETRLWYALVLNLVAGFGRTSLPQLIREVVGKVDSVTGHVLDVACGPGTYGRRVASASRTVYGIDMSPGMLQQGLFYARREGVANIRFARAKVEALPFGDAVFVAALCCGSLHLFQDTAAALREIARTMKPGARLVVLTVAAGGAGVPRFRFVRNHWRTRGLRVFDMGELEPLLSETGFANYRPELTGSLLTFTAQKRML